MKLQKIKKQEDFTKGKSVVLNLRFLQVATLTMW
jgi:hypothetical protein